MRKSLYCSICGARLTTPLTIVSGKNPKVVKPLIEVRKPIVSQGTAYKAWEATPWLYRAPGESLSFVPQYWLNPTDLTDSVQFPKNGAGLGGCCGIAGIGGPNQLCRCKCPIGTLQDDCMTPKVFIPEPDATVWVEGNEDYPAP
ncbi:hypothetical protein SPYCW_0059 [Sphingopyxis sp. EG6]|uniref:hypothetical protein n=1 Tax=Sphingopyxis sp. 2PD TaxID=2502196 RepID=UPI000DC622B7|nr:hypothetical protein [Sphingopyxis sp. 2PD]BBB07043.1 hypothetical protein SPYCW_0059 [Sphingopyxis sp. EG6]